MKYKKSISVIMPAYNSEEFIAEAIQSILDQDYGNFELIIIDDCSKDETKTIIKGFRDPRIISVRNPKNMGPAYSRNLGMSMALGKYICMMDSDDISHPDRLYEQFRYLESHSHIGCIGSAFQVIDKKGAVTHTVMRPLSYPRLKIALLMNCFIQQSTIMIRSHLIKKHRLFYNERFRYADDYDFFVRSSHLFEIRNMEQALVSYRKHDSQISIVKLTEQKKEADQIRLSQIESLGIDGTKEEIGLHMRLMREEYQNISTDLEIIEKWCNKLLEANYINKSLNQNYLYIFLENLIKKVLFLSNSPVESE